MRVGAEVKGPGIFNVSAGIGRRVFMSLAEGVVLESLRDVVLPQVRESDKPLEQEDSVLQWTKRFHLTDDWALAIACATLRIWRLCGTPEPPFMHFVMSQPRMTLETGQPCAPFQPTNESKAMFRQRAAEWIVSNLARADELVQSLGLEAAPEIHARRNKGVWRDFEWLVRYQVQGWTHKAIAREYNVTYDEAKRTSPTVARALHDTADMIGLTLRP